MTFGNVTYSQKLPGFVRNTLRDCGLPQPILIKIRQKGLSSRGLADCCHHNVCNMVKQYGGGRATGYVILKYPGIEQYQLLFHSAWVTPEENTVCITKENYKTNEGYLQDIWFIELYRGSENLNHLKMYNELIIERRRLLVRSIKLNNFSKVNWVQARAALSQPVYTQSLSVGKYNFMENNQ